MLQRKEPRSHWFLFCSFFSVKNLSRRSQALCRHPGLKVTPGTGQVILQFSQKMFSPGLSQLLTLAKSSWNTFRNVFFHVSPGPQEIGAVGDPVAHGTSQEMV